MKYAYSKRRSEFGRACNFAERPTEVLVDIEPDRDLHNQFIRVNPANKVSEALNSLSENETNTEYIELKDTGINHEEGGWPKDISASDIDHTTRYRKKLEKEESYTTQVYNICKVVEHCILQNNATKIYQEYFEDGDPLQSHPKTCAKNVVTLRDVEIVSRPVSHVSWNPDGPEKVAVAHCLLDFQCQTPGMSTDSYIWRTEDMFSPDLVLRPSSPAVCIKYCPKDANFLAGGQYNGQVVFWDLRRSCLPTEKSDLEISHRDPVYDVVWIQSKTGNECFSTSTDGKVMWWDLRNMKKPEDQMFLDPSKKDDVTRVQGGICLEYDSTMPSKFLVGTESGNVFSCSRRAKAVGEKVVSVFPAHIGPIYALQRNPAYPKNFLTVGDWSAKIWSEDGRESPIIWTPKYCEYLTGGCWSATRPSVFFVTKEDGTVDIWDLMYKMKGPEYSVKVCDEPVCCISPQESGELVALGTKQGAVVILRLDRGLVDLQRNERNLFVATVDAAIRREKILENKEREKKLALKKAQEPVTDAGKKEESLKLAESVAEAEKQFFEDVVKELKRIQQFQLKSVSSQTLIEENEIFVGGGDNAKLSRLIMENAPASKKPYTITKSHVDQSDESAATKRPSEPDYLATSDTSAITESTTADPGPVKEPKATLKQRAVVEHSAGQSTMSGHPDISKKAASTESKTADPDAVKEPKITVTSPTVVEHSTAVKHSAGHATMSGHPDISKKASITESKTADPDAVKEPKITVTSPTVVEHSTAVEHSAGQAIMLGHPDISKKAAITEYKTADPGAIKEPKAILTQAAVVEHSPTVEHSAVVGHPTMSGHLDISKKASITESTIADAGAVKEHEAIIKQPALVEHSTAVEHSAGATLSGHSDISTKAAIIEPTIADPSAAKEHKATATQTAVVEHSTAEETSAVTTSGRQTTSKKSAIAECIIAEPDSVLGHKATIEQPVVAECLILVKQADAAEHGHPAVFEHTVTSDTLSTASKHSAMEESTATEPQTVTQHSASLEPEQSIGAQHVAAIEPHSAGEHHSADDHHDKTEHSEITKPDTP